MIFSSLPFAFFFVFVFAVYWGLRQRRARHVFLLMASYAFYMSWNAWLVALILGSTLLDYGIGRGLERVRADRGRKWLLIASIVGNLGVLAVFKYADFFILSAHELLEAVGFRAHLSTLSIILPVGISFYTFQTMSYTIDVYRGRIAAEKSLLDFSLYVAFFPQLVAGPIVKARDFLPQLRTIKRFDWSRLESGSVLFLVGLTKKVLIADQLATLADPVFADPGSFHTTDLWLAMFCYAGQIYGDFAGYSDMAIAVARVLGFDLNVNFASPYLATSPTDFWHRWHISLSTWLRDYLYIPLGGSHGAKWKTARNLMTTMLLGGLWHGASWTFVLWGAIHGAVLVVAKWWRGAFGGDSRLRRHGTIDSTWSRYAHIVGGWAMTFLIVNIAWVFFRCQPVVDVATNLPESTGAALSRAMYFVTHLFVVAKPANPIWLMQKWPMVMLLALLAVMHVYEERVRLGRRPLRLPAPLAGPAYAMWILVLVVFGPENGNPFIYFQF